MFNIMDEVIVIGEYDGNTSIINKCGFVCELDKYSSFVIFKEPIFDGHMSCRQTDISIMLKDKYGTNGWWVRNDLIKKEITSKALKLFLD